MCGEGASPTSVLLKSASTMQKPTKAEVGNVQDAEMDALAVKLEQRFLLAQEEEQAQHAAQPRIHRHPVPRYQDSQNDTKSPSGDLEVFYEGKMAKEPTTIRATRNTTIPALPSQFTNAAEVQRQKRFAFRSVHGMYNGDEQEEEISSSDDSLSSHASPRGSKSFHSGMSRSQQTNYYGQVQTLGRTEEEPFHGSEAVSNVSQKTSPGKAENRSYSPTAVNMAHEWSTHGSHVLDTRSSAGDPRLYQSPPNRSRAVGRPPSFPGSGLFQPRTPAATKTYHRSSRSSPVSSRDQQRQALYNRTGFFGSQNRMQNNASVGEANFRRFDSEPYGGTVPNNLSTESMFGAPAKIGHRDFMHHGVPEYPHFSREDVPYASRPESPRRASESLAFPRTRSSRMNGERMYARPLAVRQHAQDTASVEKSNAKITSPLRTAVTQSMRAYMAPSGEKDSSYRAKNFSQSSRTRMSERLRRIREVLDAPYKQNGSASRLHITAGDTQGYHHSGSSFSKHSFTGNQSDRVPQTPFDSERGSVYEQDTPVLHCSRCLAELADLPPQASLDDKSAPFHQIQKPEHNVDILTGGVNISPSPTVTPMREERNVELVADPAGTHQERSSSTLKVGPFRNIRKKSSLRAERQQQDELVLRRQLGATQPETHVPTEKTPPRGWRNPLRRLSFLRSDSNGSPTPEEAEEDQLDQHTLTPVLEKQHEGTKSSHDASINSSSCAPQQAHIDTTDDYSQPRMEQV